MVNLDQVHWGRLKVCTRKWGGGFKQPLLGESCPNFLSRVLSHIFICHNQFFSNIFAIIFYHIFSLFLISFFKYCNIFDPLSYLQIFLSWQKYLQSSWYHCMAVWDKCSVVNFGCNLIDISVVRKVIGNYVAQDFCLKFRENRVGKSFKVYQVCKFSHFSIRNCNQLCFLAFIASLLMVQ